MKWLRLRLVIALRPEADRLAAEIHRHALDQRYRPSLPPVDLSKGLGPNPYRSPSDLEIEWH